MAGVVRNEQELLTFGATPGGVSLGSSPASLVFRPGGVANTNVFTTEAALAAATAALNGAPYQILFDLSLVSGAYTFTTVGSLTLAPNGSWVDQGNGGGAGTVLTFAHGTTLPSPPASIGGSIAITITQTQNICTVDALQPELTLKGNVQITQEASAGAFLIVTGGASGVVTVFCHDFATVFGTGAVAVLAVDSSGASLVVVALDQCTLETGTLTINPSVVDLIIASGGASIDTSLFTVCTLDCPWVDTSGDAVGVGGIPASNSPDGTILSTSVGNVTQWFIPDGDVWVPVVAHPVSTVSTEGIGAAAPAVFDGAAFITQTGKVRVTVGLTVQAGTAVANDIITFQLRKDGANITPPPFLPEVQAVLIGTTTTASATLTGVVTGLTIGSSHTFGVSATDTTHPTDTLSIPANCAYVMVEDVQ